MKKLILFCAFFILIIPACTKDKSTDAENKFQSDGIITGADYRKCMCCGGWFIDIADSTYRFYELPDGSSIDLRNETMPLEVRLDWHNNDKPCKGIIVVERIKKK